MFLYAIVYFTFANTITLAQAPDVPLYEKPVEQIVEHFANQYSVSAEKMLATMKCESGMNVKSKGDLRNGQPTSFGLSQIHLPAHPEVTIDMAFDPVFASEFMAKGFSENKATMWSCYRKLFVR